MNTKKITRGERAKKRARGRKLLENEKLKKDREMSEERRLTECCATSLERHPQPRSNARGKIWKTDNKL